MRRRKKLITAQAVLIKKLEYELKPIYNLEGIYDTTINKIVKKIFENSLFNVHEDLPLQLIKKHHLLDKFQMIKTLHMPESDESLIEALKKTKI